MLLLGKPIKGTTIAVQRVAKVKAGRAAAAAYNALAPADPVPEPRLTGDSRRGYQLRWFTAAA